MRVRIHLNPFERRKSRWRLRGMTLVEIMVVVAIIGTLSMMAYPFFRSYITRSQLIRTIRDLCVIEGELTTYSLSAGGVPESLAAIERDTVLDPWGNPYAYVKYSSQTSYDVFRKERFLFPINEEYDLYSCGPDGDSEPGLSAPVSQDDIIRANDGAFIGRASEF